jgi:hypothetical protein
MTQPDIADVVELVSQDAVTGSPDVGAPSCIDAGPPPTPVTHTAPVLGVA